MQSHSVYLFVIAAFPLQGQMESNQSSEGMTGSRAQLSGWPSIYQWCQMEGCSKRVAGPTDQSGVSPPEDRGCGTKRDIKGRQKRLST